MTEISQEDSSLLSCLQKLELGRNDENNKQPNEKQINPFMRRRRSKSLSSINFGASCDCYSVRPNVKQTVSFKRSNRRILREPVLKFVKCTHHRLYESIKIHSKSVHKPYRRKDKMWHISKYPEQDFRSIIDACEQLHLDNEDDNLERYSAQSFLNARTQTTVQRYENNNTTIGTCSHQARMNANPPCDVTIDELASYFETFVHIPKKMSTMAEMMYI